MPHSSHMDSISPNSPEISVLCLGKTAATDADARGQGGCAGGGGDGGRGYAAQNADSPAIGRRPLLSRIARCVGQHRVPTLRLRCDSQRWGGGYRVAHLTRIM